MNELPLSVRHALRRLARRLTLGLVLDVWPVCAAVGLALAGVVALVCRVFVPHAAASLGWLWLAPVVAIVPAAIIAFVRRYTPAQVAALADSLTGGDGLLLSLLERGESAWVESPRLAPVATLTLPRLRVSRRLLIVVPAAAFLAIAWLLPQRTAAASSTALATQMVGDVAATIEELKAQQLVTPEEARRLDEELERLRRAAARRMDTSSWEAADAMKERIAADLAAKRDATKWAKDSLERFAAASAGGSPAGEAGSAASQQAELMKALSRLNDAGMLAGAPPELAALATGRASFPTDAEGLRRLRESLASFLDGRAGRLGDLAGLGRGGGRFDPDEFPLGESGGEEGDRPGRGGVDRGRADAPLTFGKETQPHDRFKAQALPPGHVGGPDDWTPVVELPGAPREAAVVSSAAAAKQYEAATGQEAWRRTLAPRHQSVVRKYFEEGR